MDYLAFHSLHEDPFRLTPDPHYFYPSPDHHDALSSLEYVMQQREGFSVIVGGPGTGKTTIIRTFMARWKSEADMALVVTPRLGPDEFLEAVLEDLGVPVSSLNKNEMIKAFRNTLVERSLAGRRVIIIVDEAQSMSDETLEELRLLSNMETEKEKLLQIVLVGQRGLEKRLASANLEQLNQRIGVKAVLRELNLPEMQEYLNYRLIKAGKGTAGFSDTAVREIFRQSKGTPRLANLLASRSLMAAYMEGMRKVEKRHVGHAVKNLSFKAPATRATRVPSRRSAVAAAIVLALAIMAYTGSYVWAKVAHTFPAGFTRALAVTEPVAVKTDALVNIAYPTVVVAVNARLRQGPSTEAPTVGSAKTGDILQVIEKQQSDDGRNWFLVKTESGRDGWISARATSPANSPPGSPAFP
jgi:general secretion pathway protein A